VPKLAEIQVFRPGQKALMRPLRKASTLTIARNPKDGSFYVRNAILIRLRLGADFSELLKLLQATGGILVGVYPGLGIYRVRSPQGSDVPGFASLPVGYKGDPRIYAGTSISAAFAANQIGGILSKIPKATKQEILVALRKKP
jgi:hypothetical protein